MYSDSSKARGRRVLGLTLETEFADKLKILAAFRNASVDSSIREGLIHIFTTDPSLEQVPELRDEIVEHLLLKPSRNIDCERLRKEYLRERYAIGGAN